MKMRYYQDRGPTCVDCARELLPNEAPIREVENLGNSCDICGRGDIVCRDGKWRPFHRDMPQKCKECPSRERWMCMQYYCCIEAAASICAADDTKGEPLCPSCKQHPSVCDSCMGG